MPDPDLRALLESWIIHLRAERKAEGTVGLYATGVRTFLAWCDRQRRPVTLDRSTAAAFIAELLNNGRARYWSPAPPDADSSRDQAGESRGRGQGMTPDMAHRSRPRRTARCYLDLSQAVGWGRVVRGRCRWR
jgi:Phage integrase, N-terminal SAM-like domain